MSPARGPRPDAPVEPPARAPALAGALDRVGDRWTLLVVGVLLQGPKRFGELQAAVEGIAPNILSQRLKQLDREGLLVGRPYSRRPVRLVYELTASGRELAGVVGMLAEWGARRAGVHDVPRHAVCGTPLETRSYCATCARLADENEAADVRHL